MKITTIISQIDILLEALKQTQTVYKVSYKEQSDITCLKIFLDLSLLNLDLLYSLQEECKKIGIEAEITIPTHIDGVLVKDLPVEKQCVTIHF